MNPKTAFPPFFSYFLKGKFIKSIDKNLLLNKSKFYGILGVGTVKKSQLKLKEIKKTKYIEKVIF